MSSSDLAQAPAAPDTVLDIDSTRPLCPLLVADVTALCDRMEDAGGASSAVIRLHGTGPAENWPGDVGIDVVSRWERALRRLEQGRFAKIVTVEGVCSGPALDVLFRHLNPLHGGHEGAGWPFGRPVQYGEVFGVLQRAVGDVLVEEIRMFAADPITGRRGAPVDRIDIGPGTLVFSYQHQVVVTASDTEGLG